MRKDFAVFILTHGRANSMVTYQTLKRCGYHGQTYFLLDNEDNERRLYERNFGKENVLVFDKEKYVQLTDTCDTTGERRAIVFARNAVFDVARELGLTYFLMLDDDFDAFAYKYEKDGILREDSIKDLDSVFDIMLDFLDDTGAKTVAFCQNGDLIGGRKSPKYLQKVLRKAMNTFFCRTDNPIQFKGTMNEDVNTFSYGGSIGELFLSICDVSIHQRATQAGRRGMSNVYKESGTYTKSFYSVMTMPSAIKLKTMGLQEKRIHHEIMWNHCMPKILNQKWKK